MRILIDDLSMTWSYDNVSKIYDQLQIEDVTTQPIRTKYYNYGEYFDGVLIAYNTDDMNNITDTYLDLSGKGCRTIEQLANNHKLITSKYDYLLQVDNSPDFDWFEFLHQYDSQIKDKTCHISRLDVACDLLDGELPMDVIYRYTRSLMYVCRSKVLPDLRYMRTEEIYFGSPRSDRLLRIYNKALEQNLPDTYWVRMEFQLRNDCATSWYLNWCQCRDVGKLYSGIMIDYLRFVQGSPQEVEAARKNDHMQRLPTARWWTAILGEVERIPQLYLPAEEYTINKLEHYLEKQTYSSLKTYAIAHDGDISNLIDGVKHVELNAKQKIIVQKLNLIKNITKSDLEE